MRAVLPPGDETRLVREFLGAEPGFFVDVGANDPKQFSQTWELEQNGWTGILIEPQPNLADQLRSERKAKVYAVACSAAKNSGTSMPLHIAGPLSSLRIGWTKWSDGILMVPVYSLDHILTESKAPVPIDFLSIDVEGHTCEVLDGVDLSHWRPRLILVEDHVMDLRVHRRMIAAGYRWIRRTGLNGWYVPTENKRAIGFVGRCQFIRKYYLGIPFRHIREAMRRVRGHDPNARVPTDRRSTRC